jgi:hypothetical protein
MTIEMFNVVRMKFCFTNTATVTGLHRQVCEYVPNGDSADHSEGTKEIDACIRLVWETCTCLRTTSEPTSNSS